MMSLPLFTRRAEWLRARDAEISEIGRALRHVEIVGVRWGGDTDTDAHALVKRLVAIAKGAASENYALIASSDRKGGAR